MENTQIQKTESTEMVNLKDAQGKLAAMMAFVKSNMKEGLDYMKFSKDGKKDSLLKPGAEKMNILMGFYPEYDILKEITNPADDYYDVTIKCTLRSRKDQTKVAEGIGSCNNKEPAKIAEAKAKGMTMYGHKNSILKIAEKRA